MAEPFATLDEAIAALTDSGPVTVDLPPMPDPISPSVPGNGLSAARDAVRGGERFEASEDTLRARTSYVVALTADRHPNFVVMCRLVNLARAAGHPAQAARGFRLSLVYDPLGQA